MACTAIIKSSRNAQSSKDQYTGHELLFPQNSYLTEQKAPNPEGGSLAEVSMQTPRYSVFTQQMHIMRSFIESLNWNQCSCINSDLLHYTQCRNSPFFLWLLVWASSSLMLSAGPSGFASGLSLIPLLLFWSDFSSFSLLFVGFLLWLIVLHCKRHKQLLLAVQLLIPGGAHFLQLLKFLFYYLFSAPSAGWTLKIVLFCKVHF